MTEGWPARLIAERAEWTDKVLGGNEFLADRAVRIQPTTGVRVMGGHELALVFFACITLTTHSSPVILSAAVQDDAHQLSRDELIQLAHDNDARIMDAFAARDPAVYMKNKAQSLHLFAPVSARTSYDLDYYDAWHELIPLLDGSIERLFQWPRQFYIGNNTVTYILSSL